MTRSRLLVANRALRRGMVGARDRGGKAGPSTPSRPTVGGIHGYLELQRLAGNASVASLLTVQRCGGERHEGCACAGPIARSAVGPVQRQQQATVLISPKFAGNARLQAAANNHPAMSSNDRGEAVVLLQEALVQLGFPLPKSTKPDGSMDGGYGAETAGAVSQFQLREKVQKVPDGSAGRKTLSRMDALLLLQPQPQQQPQQQPVTDDVLVTLAKVERATALRKAFVMLSDHLDFIRTSPIIGINEPVAAAVKKWLLVEVGTPGYEDAVEKAIKLISASLETSTEVRIDRGTSCKDFAFVPKVGDPSVGITVCDLFFKSNLGCQREVMAHEFFHVLGLGPEHHYGTTKTDEALKCAHHMAELAFELATGVTESCSQPPVNDIKPEP